jgi:hypothetical protein
MSPKQKVHNDYIARGAGWLNYKVPWVICTYLTQYISPSCSPQRSQYSPVSPTRHYRRTRCSLPSISRETPAPHRSITNILDTSPGRYAFT